MTTITSSILFSVSVQKDGRQWVVEVHVDSLGVSYQHTYLASAAADLNANLAAWAPVLLAQLGTAEISANLNAVTTLGSLATPTFNYSIVADNVTALRAAYLTATQTQAVMMGDYLNTLTSLQLQNAFGLSAGQVTTLRANKLTPAATLAASIRASVGQ